MPSWIVDWQAIGINEDGVTFAVVLDHLSDYWKDCGLKMDPAIFEINLPFYMESERWWQNHNLNRKKISNRNTYMACLSEKEKKLIEWIKNKVNPSIPDSKDDNSLAKIKARQIHLRSSGIDSISGDKVYSNLENCCVFTKVAYQNYIIPKLSCFISSDVKNGLNMFLDTLKQSKEVIGDGKFLIIIDPPWENKSVKRKRSYISQGSDDILQVFSLLNEICKLLLIDNQRDIRIALWTTQKFKQLCLDQLLPMINMKLVASLLWHKITKSWESIKIRGGREYLLIASSTGRKTALDGMLISVPSAIHSHKPAIGFDFPWLEHESNHCFEQVEEICNMTEPLRQDQYPKLRGIELYARYLRPNFLSIGYECIKLQSSDVFIHQ